MSNVMLLIITSTGDMLLVVSTSITLNDLEPKNRGFSDFFAIFWCRRVHCDEIQKTCHFYFL